MELTDRQQEISVGREALAAGRGQQICEESPGAVINNAGQDLPLAESAAETEIGSRIQPPSGRQAAGRQQASQQRFWRQIAVIRCQRAEPRFRP
jgi:hypothetical protein